MSRADLDRIQTQLKVAIQSHQILVGKMKNDPQNTALQKQLHELQSQITSLSEKQKTIVQTLRKELVIKQSTPSVQVASVASLSPGVATGSLNQTTCAKPTCPDISNSMTHAAKVPRISNPSGRPPTIAQLTSVQSSSTASFYRPPNPARIQASSSTTNNNTIKGKALSPKSSYPAIRVPQYPGSRPSILMGGQSSPNTQRPSGVLKNSCASNLPLTAQRGSDADLENMKHSSIDQKELPPGERQKLEYMASLDLITPDTLKELQRKRSERKRRSTANPQFSYGHFEPEKKRSSLSYLKQGQLVFEPRKRGRPPKRFSEGVAAAAAAAAAPSGGMPPVKRRPGRPRSVSSALPPAPPASLHPVARGLPQIHHPVPSASSSSYRHLAPRGVARTLSVPSPSAPSPSAPSPSAPSSSGVDSVFADVGRPYGGGLPSQGVAREAGRRPSCTTTTATAWQLENDVHEDFCAVCRRSGELLMCDTCNLVYHLGCLEPPLTTIPQGLWSCPNCQTMSKHGGVTWPGSLALVHSYITHKAAREEEKRSAEKKNGDLKSEKTKLENRAKQLTEAMKQHLKQKAELLSAKSSAQQSVDTLKTLIRVFHAS